MMKTLKILFFSAIALLTLAACNNKEDSKDDNYYAGLASISCNDASFTATSTGGTISFAVEGGQVVVYVDCEIDWTASNSAPDWLDAYASVQSGTLTLTAGQSTVETQQSATVKLATANAGVEFATITVTQTAYDAPTITLTATEWNAPAVGTLTTQIGVEASGTWTVQNTSSWLTAEKTDNGISLTAEENESTEERTTEVTVTCDDGISTVSATVAVVQDGKAYLTLSEDSIRFLGDGDSATITADSNFDVSYSSEASWLTVNYTEGQITASVEANDEDAIYRATTVTVTAGDGAKNVAESQFTVTQYSSKTMILVYTTTDAETEIIPPISQATSYQADWGDGSEIETLTAGFPTHTYAEPGEYYLALYGTITQLNKAYTYVTQEYLTSVKQWGSTGLTSMFDAFLDCVNLKSIPEHTGSVFANLKSGLIFQWWATFKNCSSLEAIPADFFADNSGVTMLSYTFQGCSSLKEIPEGLFDNCDITAFSYAFQDCTGLTSIPTGLFDNSKDAISFEGTFSGCTGVTGESPYTVVDGTKVHLYERADYPSTFTTLTVYTSCFKGCTQLTDYEDIPTAWK